MPQKKHAIYIAFLAIFLTIHSPAQIKDLKKWLSIEKDLRPSLESLQFSKEHLNKKEAVLATALLIKDKQAQILNDYGTSWDNRSLTFEGFTMPFFYHIFGNKPTDGRSLFISLHGGGNTTAQTNDQQYNNQKHLYDATMKNQEGVYMALRAPTNTWDLWHQNHIDDFLNIIIQLAVIKENVNPNKVYIMGYSAGGDGLYQLAPRMADRWAAASMMAGHPNDASPLNLRNLPFAIHMGALDNAYDRNNIAQTWGKVLDSLESKYSGNYIHDVHLHEGLGHWMKLNDSIAIPWMKRYKRNPLPQKVTWRQDNRHHESFYWLGTPKNAIKTEGIITAEYHSLSNSINITNNYSETCLLFINDNMLNLNKPATIKYQGKVIHKGILNRSILNIYQTLSNKGDTHLAFPSVISIKDNKTIKKDPLF